MGNAIIQISNLASKLVISDDKLGLLSKSILKSMKSSPNTLPSICSSLSKSTKSYIPNGFYGVIDQSKKVLTMYCFLIFSLQLQSFLRSWHRLIILKKFRFREIPPRVKKETEAWVRRFCVSVQGGVSKNNNATRRTNIRSWHSGGEDACGTGFSRIRVADYGAAVMGGKDVVVSGYDIVETGMEVIVSQRQSSDEDGGSRKTQRIMPFRS